jgi:hypothetical protein
MPVDDSKWKSNFARDVLGPILFAACHRLWLHQIAVTAKNPLALYSARGGLRILDLFQRFLEKQHLSKPVACAPFMISRLSVMIAGWHRAPAIAVSNIMKEFHDKSWETLGPALIPETVDKNIHNKVKQLADLIGHERINELNFYQVLNNDNQYKKAFLQHVKLQESLFDQYLHDLTKGHKHLLLCDTGLFASSQLMLMAGWPEYQWHGFYLGRSNYRHQSAPHFNYASGLILETDYFTTKRPESALLNHWHLLEMPLEPDIPSVTHYFQINNKIRCNAEITDWKDYITASDNPYYQGIIDYFGNINKPLAANIIYSRSKNALYALQKMICTPTLKDVYILKLGNRNADFGQNKEVPVITIDAQNFNKKFFVIRSALWKEGQIRVEFNFIGTFINYTIFQIKRIPCFKQVTLIVFKKIFKVLRPC